MKRNAYQGDANSLRGDPINGPLNTAKKNASAKTDNAKKNHGGKSKDDNDSETDGGFMMTTSEILDFAEGTDSTP